MKSSRIGILAPLLLLYTSAVAADISNIAAPWPPPRDPTGSPFAKLPCTSYSSYKRNGVEIDPIWGSIEPYDFGSRAVRMDYSGLRQVNQIPAPGIHPRIYCTPDDLPEIRRRLKETRCGQAEWKNLLCYCNFLKGTFDPKASYAQPDVPPLPGTQAWQARVPLSRLQSGPDQRAVAARYHALINGDLTQKTDGLWHVFDLEAFRCWVDDDTPAAHDLAAAVITGLRIEQAIRNKTRKDKTAPLEQPIAGIHLAYIYDFLYNFLSADQRKAIHDELANGTWNHDNYGTFNDATQSRSNWATFSYWLVEVLAIEGEPGFNDLKVRGIYRGWHNLLTYGWFQSGATYEGEAKDQLGMDGILAFSIRTKAYGLDNLAAHPYLRAYATNFLPKSVIPTRNGFVKYDLLGGARGMPLSTDMIGLKYLYPNDKIIDWIYRASVGENYENIPNRCEAGGYDPAVWGGYFDAMIPFLIFASDYDPSNDDPAKFGVSNTFFCPERSLMMTRSSWDKDAMMLNMHVRQANGGHPFADRNSILVAGAGRVWSAIYGWGENGWENIHNSEVVIDDHPQADHIPARMIAFVDNPQATFATGDAKYAWDWNWKFNDTWGARGIYTMQDYKEGGIKVDKAHGWELEQHCVNDFSYLKLPYDYLDAPLATQPSWIAPMGAIRPIARQPNYEVQCAFRTAGLVRGPHPYGIIVDDIQKDAQAHDYVWYMALEYDIQIARQVNSSPHEMDLILTGSDPLQKNSPSPAANAKPEPALPAQVDASTVIPAGQPMLLIRFLNYNNTEPEEIKTEARTPTILEDAPPPDIKGHYLQRVRRLAVPAHAISPGFKVLIYPFHQGDVLPTTTWNGGNSVSVSLPGQADQVQFSPGDSGKTGVTVVRGNTVLARMDQPVPPLPPAKE